MNYDGFIGPTYTGQSVSVDGERTVNFYPEIIDGGAHGKALIVFYRTPGTKLLQTIDGGPTGGIRQVGHRGMITVNGRTFGVVGINFGEIVYNGKSFNPIGTVNNDGNPVELATNGIQIFVLAAQTGYCFTLLSGAWVVVSGTGAFPPQADSLCSIDGYFIVLETFTNQFYISALLDGTSWSGLDFGSSEEPENAVAIAQNHLYLWIFGQNNTIIFYNSGAASFPFQRVPGSQIEQGIAAKDSICQIDNTLMWLGSDARGAGVCYRANGFLPERVSNHAVEYAWQQYSTLADATAFSYQDGGHLFYVLNFPTANATWVYDVSSKMWHERGTWVNNFYNAVPGRFHAFNWGMHLVGDYSNGNLYQMSTNYATDNGAPIRWLRAAPHISNEEGWLFYPQLQVDMQVGNGLDAGLPGSNPLVWMQYSNDGGFTWSNELSAPVGPQGAYLTRVIWRRLGRSRNRVFRVYGSDPVPTVALIAAYLKVEKGTS
jgi:hypothetical protein